MQQVLPAFMYPTTLLCVDDNALFLKYLTSQLTKTHQVKIFDTPNACVNFFNHYAQSISIKDFLSHITEGELYNTREHASIDLNFFKIAGLSQQVDKSNEISVLIVDFDMPEMNGIELCRTLKALNIKKILLTGTVDLKQAV